MKKGFTVLELLLTITVILLLVSLSLQSYANAQRQARIAACKVYRKQVETLHAMPEYDFSTSDPIDRSTEDIDHLIKAYNHCFDCHSSAWDMTLIK